MIEIVNDKYLKIVCGTNEWTFPHTILVSIGDVLAIEFDCKVTGDKPMESSRKTPDRWSMDYTWTYEVTCNVKFTHGNDIQVLFWRGDITTTDNPRPFNEHARDILDKLTKKIEDKFMEAKASFQTAVRNEAFELLMTNKLINQKTI